MGDVTMPQQCNSPYTRLIRTPGSAAWQKLPQMDSNTGLLLSRVQNMQRVGSFDSRSGVCALR